MDFIEKAKNWLSGKTQDATQPIADAVPTAATDSGAQQALGTPSEPSGYTMGGGRRVKTRRHRKGKKTHKRKQRKQH